MLDSLGKPHNDGRIDTRNGRHKRLGAHGDDERIGRHLLHKDTAHLAPKAHVKLTRALEPGNLVLEIAQVASDILLVGFLGDKPHIAAHAIGALREHHLVTARAGCDRRHAAGRAGTHHEYALRNLRGLHRARNKILVGKARVHAAAHVPAVRRNVVALQTAQARHDILGTVVACLGGPQGVGGQGARERHHVAGALGDGALRLLGRLDGAHERHGDIDCRLDGTGELQVEQMRVEVSCRSVHVGLVLDIEPAGDLNACHVALGLAAKRDDVVKPYAARHPLVSRDAHLHGEARPHGLAAGAQHLQGKAHAIFDGAAVPIRAVVEQRA